MILLFACAKEEPPAAAAAGETYTFVMSSLAFSRRADDGTTWGFDLDDHVSEAGDDESCGHADLVDPEGLVGIDSAFSGMIPALEATEAGAVEGLVEDSIANGELLLLAELSGVDDPVDDDCVDVRVLRGAGTPMIGTDGALLDGQTFALAEGYAPAEVACVPIVDGSLRAGPFELGLDLQVLDVALSFGTTDTWIRADLAEDGSTAWGYFGGAVATSDVLVIVEEPDLEEIAGLVTGLVLAAADMHPDEDEACQSLSIVFEYGAVEAFVLE